jgi:ribonucleoside-diphosphate reductase alpha chain
MTLSDKAQKIWNMKYAQTKKDGTKESWEEGCWRVAHYVAGAEREYGATEQEVIELAKDYYRMMVNLMFIPGGRILANSGTGITNLFNCFVLPVGDSRVDIYNALGTSAEIFAHGGGVGYNFSYIRERGAPIKSTGGKASGPLSFMELFDATGEVIQQASRRGAQMGILNIDHPDIELFIDYKASPNPKHERIVNEFADSIYRSSNSASDDFINEAAKKLESIITDNQLTHFNISVGISDKFMEAVENDWDWDLISRVDGSVVKTVKAKDLMRKIAESAWRSGDPGVIFLDRLEEGNMVPYLGKLEATNPCSEVTLLPNEPCCLGSINLSLMIEDGVVSEKKLMWVTTMATRFLDNVHTINKTPIEVVNQAAKATRRLGLGVMGWADVLVQLGIPYDDEAAIQLAEEVMKSISTTAWATSQYLAEDRGPFDAFDKDNVYNIARWVLRDGDAVRNVAVTSIAPTGTIALLADVNSGIEPFFALTYTRYITEGVGNVIKDKIVEVNPHVQSYFESKGLFEDQVAEVCVSLKRNGDFSDTTFATEEDKSVFKTAGEIGWKDHINMQAAFQKYVDNAISKTINMPNESTVEDVMDAYRYAWAKGLKSTALYRDGSKSFQILNK